MAKSLLVAWREFAQTVFRPVFILAVLGLPVVLVGILIIAGLAMATHEQPPLVGTVVVVEASGEVAEVAESLFTEESQQEFHREQLERDLEAIQSGSMTATPPMLQRGEVHITIEAVEEQDEATIDELRERVRRSELLAVAVVAPSVLDAGSDSADSDEDEGNQPVPADAFQQGLELFVAPKLNNDHAMLIERRIREAVVNVRASRAGLDVEEARRLLELPRARTTRLLEQGGIAEEDEIRMAARELMPMMFMMLLWIATFTAGQRLLMSTVEEKSNRIMEVLLSAISPFQLMTGKIIGHGAVGLLVIGIYLIAALAGLIVFNVMDIIDPMTITYLILYFFMAYFMVAALMAAVGSAVSDIQEANTLITPVMLILMVPLFLWFPISQAPNGVIALVFSFLPPAIPFAMILRIPAEEPVPFWQIIATLLWGYACMGGMVWFAAKIFRVGILMTGKPPSPLEMIRWLRYS